MSKEQKQPKVTKDSGNPYLSLLVGLGVPLALAGKLDRRLALADRAAKKESAARRVARFRKIRAAGRLALVAAGAGL